MERKRPLIYFAAVAFLFVLFFDLNCEGRPALGRFELQSDPVPAIRPFEKDF